MTNPAACFFLLFFSCTPLLCQQKYPYVRASSNYKLEFINFHGKDSVEHFISYYDNGQKACEYYYKNGRYFDTLKLWFDDGTLYVIQVQEEKGYKEITYNWNSREEGFYLELAQQPKAYVLDDSVTWTRHTVDMDSYKKPPYYVRTGIWKEFYADGSLKAQGQYLPEEFYCLCPDERKVIKRGFEMEAWIFNGGNKFEGLCAGGAGYLKDGEWIYYDIAGQETHREYYSKGLCTRWR